VNWSSLEDALVSYDRVLALRPNFAEALLNRGITLQGLKRLKRFEEALATYDLALSIQADYV
jgi:tetratricopeptide (TPR) repeat protein